jgi:hypothetical protein
MTNAPWWAYSIVIVGVVLILYVSLVAISQWGFRQEDKSSGDGRPPARNSTLARVAEKVRRKLTGGSTSSSGSKRE